MKEDLIYNNPDPPIVQLERGSRFPIRIRISTTKHAISEEAGRRLFRELGQVLEICDIKIGGTD